MLPTYKASADLPQSCAEKNENTLHNHESMRSKHVLLFSDKLPPRFCGASATRTLHKPPQKKQTAF